MHKKEQAMNKSDVIKPVSIEDLAVMYMAGEPIVITDCYCQEFAHQVLHQAAEIQLLKEKIKSYEGVLCQDQKKT